MKNEKEIVKHEKEKKKEEQPFLLQQPIEILKILFQLLDYRSLVNLLLVSKDTNKVANELLAKDFIFETLKTIQKPRPSFFGFISKKAEPIGMKDILVMPFAATTDSELIPSLIALFQALEKNLKSATKSAKTQIAKVQDALLNKLTPIQKRHFFLQFIEKSHQNSQQLPVSSNFLLIRQLDTLLNSNEITIDIADKILFINAILDAIKNRFDPTKNEQMHSIEAVSAVKKAANDIFNSVNKLISTLNPEETASINLKIKYSAATQTFSSWELIQIEHQTTQALAGVGRSFHRM